MHSIEVGISTAQLHCICICIPHPSTHKEGTQKRRNAKYSAQHGRFNSSITTRSTAAWEKTSYSQRPEFTDEIFESAIS